MSHDEADRTAEARHDYTMNSVAKFLCGASLAVIAVSETAMFTDHLSFATTVYVCGVASVGLASGVVVDGLSYSRYISGMQGENQAEEPVSEVVRLSTSLEQGGSQATIDHLDETA